MLGVVVLTGIIKCLTSCLAHSKQRGKGSRGEGRGKGRRERAREGKGRASRRGMEGTRGRGKDKAWKRRKKGHGLLQDEKA